MRGIAATKRFRKHRRTWRPLDSDYYSFDTALLTASPNDTTPWLRRLGHGEITSEYISKQNGVAVECPFLETKRTCPDLFSNVS